MAYYHMSETLKIGQEMVNDFKQQEELTMPFVEVLEFGREYYVGMILNAKYLRAALGKFGFRDMPTNYTKWACEGAFEFIRKTEFPTSCSRIRCNYFYDNLDDVRRLYEVDWAGADEETKGKMRLFEMELDAQSPQKRDMLLFDAAFDALYEDLRQIDYVLDCARDYFRGKPSEHPVWEILCDQPARAVADLTDSLHAGNARR